jgi:hypothetical protein
LQTMARLTVSAIKEPSSVPVEHSLQSESGRSPQAVSRRQSQENGAPVSGGMRTRR